MAKYKKGINGPFTGKVGPVTGSSWKGTPYVKSNNSVLPEREPSVAQRNQRMVFAMVSSWLRPMKEWIGIGYAAAAIHKTEMNAAISFVLREALTGTAPNVSVNYPKMVWSMGPLLASFVTRCEVLGDTILHIDWENAAASFYCGAEDEAVFILYNPEKSQFLVFPGLAMRGDRAVELPLPPDFAADLLHGYMLYRREAMLSTSVYLAIC